MVTESVDKVKVPDQVYLGYWENTTVVMPFVGYDLFFTVFDEAREKTLSWISISNGFALVRPK